MATMTAKSHALNATQLVLLETFAGIRDEKEAEEISLLIRDYLARKLDAEMEKLYNDGTLSDEKFEEWRHEHLRTPYRL